MHKEYEEGEPRDPSTRFAKDSYGGSYHQGNRCQEDNPVLTEVSPRHILLVQQIEESRKEEDGFQTEEDKISALDIWIELFPIGRAGKS